ncbi:MAG: hypothetical protein FVQ84_08410 [Planctomycetes bacterium]|nr:hypothetical protein [Planctomycetota bacterium]
MGHHKGQGKTKRRYAPKELLETLRYMMWDLIDNRLEVCLVASDRDPDGQIRRVFNRNLDWYRNLCSKYPGRSKSHKYRLKHESTPTKIRRIRILQALRTIETKGYCHSYYAEDLFEIAQEIITAFEEQGYSA